MSPTRRHPTLPRVLALALTAIALLAIPASASATVDNFEGGDGKQTAAMANCSTTVDWACLRSPAGLYRAIDDPTPDDVFVSGSENDPDSWKLGTGTVSPSKSDIQAAWAAGAGPANKNVIEL